MSIKLANPRGFCAGVERAIEIVHRALDCFGKPVYVRHEVVHNRCVVEDLRARGTVFVNAVSEVPDGAILIFSAHGVSRAVYAEAQRRGLRVFDATCPLVTKVHMAVRRLSMAGRECVLIGHRGHPEVEGTMGQYERDRGGIYLVEDVQQAAQLQVRRPDELSYVTQTTLSVEDTADVIAALRARFPNMTGPKRDDICYATQNRQQAVRGIAKDCDLVLVVGSSNSSNSNRLRELAERAGASAYLVDTAEDIQPEWLADCRRVGVTAGASAPEALVRQVIERLRRHQPGLGEVIEVEGKDEDVVFVLPRALREMTAAHTAAAE